MQQSSPAIANQYNNLSLTLVQGNRTAQLNCANSAPWAKKRQVLKADDVAQPGHATRGYM